MEDIIEKLIKKEINLYKAKRIVVKSQDKQKQRAIFCRRGLDFCIEYIIFEKQTITNGQLADILGLGSYRRGEKGKKSKTNYITWPLLQDNKNIIKDGNDYTLSDERRKYYEDLPDYTISEIHWFAQYFLTRLVRILFKYIKNTPNARNRATEKDLGIESNGSWFTWSILSIMMNEEIIICTKVKNKTFYSIKEEKDLKEREYNECDSEEKMSKMEKATFDYLKKLNIIFKKEQTFNNLKDKQHLRFDFYLGEYNALIECDGKQHFEYTPLFGNFESTQKHDKTKMNYCVENGISILRICYKDDHRIPELVDQFLDMLSKTPGFNYFLSSPADYEYLQM